MTDRLSRTLTAVTVLWCAAIMTLGCRSSVQAQDDQTGDEEPTGVERSQAGEPDAEPDAEPEPARSREANDRRRRALIIAISEYSYFADLSAHNDIDLIEGALLTNGFSERDIRVVTNATGETLRDALNGLVEAAEPGSLLYLHYSGHGAQTPDDDRPREEPDARDEVFVGSDASPSNRGALVRDDEFATVLQRIRSRLGPDGHLLVTVDACHSGTISRGALQPRSAGFIEDPEAGETGETADETASRGTDPEPGGGLLEASDIASRGADDAAPITIISAARHDQLAWETEDDWGDPVG